MRARSAVALGLGVALAGLAASRAQAASIVYTTNNTNWALGTSWAGGVVPGPADTAFVRNNQTSIIDSTVANIAALNLGEAGANGTVSIQTNGSLTVTGDAQVMRRGTLANAQGTVTMTGGNLSVGGTLFVGNGTSANSANGFGALTMGGSSSLTAAITLGSASQDDGTGTFTVTGSDVNVGDGGASKPLTVNDFGTINFNLGATIGSAWNYAASAVAFNAGAGLIVDGTNYTGPDGTFTLINGASLVGTAATVDESVVNFAPGRTATINFDTANGDVTLTIVPEPASAAVLATAGLLAACTRRRRR
jgi:hypothetical protein